MTTVLQASPGGFGLVSAFKSTVRDLSNSSPQLQTLQDVKDVILRGLGQSLTWASLAEEVVRGVPTRVAPPPSMLRRVDFDLGAEHGSLRGADFVAVPEVSDDYSW